MNLTSSFPVPSLHCHGKSPFPPSNTVYPNKFISFTNSYGSDEGNSFQVSFSLTQQNFNNPFNISFLLSPNFSSYKSPLSKITAAASTTSAATPNSNASSSRENVHWTVIMDKPPDGIQSKAEIIYYYVSTLQRAVGSEKDAQSRIYDASWDTDFLFCCIVDEETSLVLAGLPGVLSVKPDPAINSVNKDDSAFILQENSVLNSLSEGTSLLPNCLKHWLVRVVKPSIGVSSKAQAVDFCVNVLTKVLGNEKDAQMCIYHLSWQSDFGFCCKLDDKSAVELATVPGVLSVRPDENFESNDKDYGGHRMSFDAPDYAGATEMSKTKLFITGLSFYTSEKTLRAVFEPFGELVEVKVIMDKISKRSKGYAFVEYTTEDAATMALQEMNGKIINGWMIVVDRAKSKPRYAKECLRPLSSQDRRVM